ncbi:hypothetical protein BFW87_24795 [Pseudomonas fluorescens]|uniref:Uncharacterized protein n=1 Tax=Pseudomonas fluorescens TaxID=294 RepID=A0A1T2Y355_PSEFL|nr:hypothetical protein BFW87_24795 [Pseudomonas fluorescens]
MWELGFCGSWLACDAGASVSQSDRGDAIAGKPAPTQARPLNRLMSIFAFSTNPTTERHYHGYL